MRADLLLLVADHLENNVRDYEYNHETWWCRTAGCALGHACDIPQLQEMGLRLVRTSHFGRIVFCGHDVDGMNAAKVVFDLSEAQAFFLFGFENYDDDHSRMGVVKRIRDFVKPFVTAEMPEQKPVSILPKVKHDDAGTAAIAR